MANRRPLHFEELHVIEKLFLGLLATDIHNLESFLILFAKLDQFLAKRMTGASPGGAEKDAQHLAPQNVAGDLIAIGIDQYLR